MRDEERVRASERDGSDEPEPMPERTKRASGMPRVAPGFLLVSFPGLRSLFFSYPGLRGLISLSLRLCLAAFGPLSCGNGLTLSPSPSHSRGEEPSIQFSP